MRVERNPDTAPVAVHEEPVYHFLWGILPDKRVRTPEEVCPTGTWGSTTYLYSFFDKAVMTVTVGIVIPQTMRVECRQ